MFPLCSKKFIMAGIITITLPFGGGFAITGATNPPTNPVAVNSGAGSNTSYNWSGYQATGGTYTGATGTWTIPAVASATSTEADATWVGIGGVASHDLIQAGTQAVINGSGAPTYEAWYETLPQATTQVPLTVSPGDSISVSLQETSPSSNGSPSMWSVSIHDNTSGQSYATAIAYNSSLSSAEWIEEMPSDGANSFVALDNFGTVSFTGATATVNGSVETLAGANAQALTMVNRAGQPLATTSAIGADGESFSVTRTSALANVGGGAGAYSSGGSGYVVIGGRGGLGRGWRRTGVGIQGYTSRVTSTPASSGANAGGSGGNPWNQFYRIMQQMQQLQQNFRQNFQRNNFRDGRIIR